MQTTIPTTSRTTLRTTDESTAQTTKSTTAQTTKSTTQQTTVPTTSRTTLGTTDESTAQTTKSTTAQTTKSATQQTTTIPTTSRTTLRTTDESTAQTTKSTTAQTTQRTTQATTTITTIRVTTDIDACLAAPCHVNATCTDHPAPALDATCTCHTGYAGDGLVSGTGCLDIDACLINPCHVQAICTDNPAPALDATCTCNTGYTGDGLISGSGCSDIDACLANPCHVQATCTDNPAPALDATCTCNTGYTGDGLVTGNGCSDIDACLASPCHVNATCTDNPAPALDATCTCNAGYTGDGHVSGNGCSDIDACLDNHCHVQATCTDNPAPALDATCTCNTGYTGDGLVTGNGCSDIDACLASPCHVNATCTDNPAPALDATCTCNTGYTGDGLVSGNGCSDINACLASPCHVNATCTDNPAPALDATCTCNTGYTGDGLVSGNGCSDIDACSDDPCDVEAICTDNSAPALDATCTCNTGYTGDGLISGSGCSDIDACLASPCHVNATCTDNPAPALDATCTCNTGYMGDGHINGNGCSDIDACLDNPCHVQATCTDNPAPDLDATCTCNTGYTGDGLLTGNGCSDIDACYASPCHVNATCTDNPAPALDATCTCNAGYTGDGHVGGNGCSDIDACLDNPCHVQATCTDNPAPALDATCTCNTGYTGDGLVTGNGCSDIDACLASPCHVNATCTDNPAPALDATCTCNAGYTGDGLVSGNGCSDIDACLASPCHVNASCTDNPAPALDATCTCNTGYTGDGLVSGNGCSDIDACLDNPCHVQATCTDNPAPALDATCTCNTGYTGDGLLTGNGCSDIDACLASPCHVNATCTDNPAPALDATCTCNTGYTGDGLVSGNGCSDIDACSDDPCDVEATCTDNPAPALDATCTCNTGYTGDGLLSGSGCNDIDACLDNPCHVQATCTDNPAPALNATCTCNTGYAGDGLADGSGCTDINKCDPNPCQNGGICTVRGNSYNCRCSREYAGRHCEKELENCGRNKCHLDGYCNNALARCVCHEGYRGSGTFCSKVVTHHFACRFPTIIFTIRLLVTTSPAFGFWGRIVRQPFETAIRRKSLYVTPDYDGDGTDDNYDMGVENMRVLRFRPGSVIAVYELNITEHTIPELELFIRNLTADNRIGNLSIQSNYTVLGDEALVRCHCELDSEKCVEGKSNWTCECREGYTRTTDGTCEDVDECALDIDTCSDDSDCVNTRGSYTCSFCKPMVSILGGGRTILRSDRLQLNSVIEYSPKCAIESIRGIRYDWTFNSTDEMTQRRLSQLARTQQADIKIQPKTMAVGKVTFFLTVVAVDDRGIELSSQTSTTITVTFAPLMAGILGGSRRQTRYGTLTLDAATLSFDPNGLLSCRNLTYTWACTERANNECPELRPTSDCGKFLASVKPELFTRVFTFTLTVSAPERIQGTATQIIEVVESSIPSPQIICEELHGTCGPVINEGEQMKLMSNCTNCDQQSDDVSYQYWWTLVASPAGYSEWADRDYDNNLLNERDQDYLVLKANVFDKPGDYTMRLNITESPTNFMGYAEYIFTTNGPPSIGSCRVMPPDGTASIDDFRICCEGFHDPDQPLTYNFLYETDIDIASVNTTSTNVLQLLYTGPENCTALLKLPLGNRSDNYRLPIRVQVVDKYGGSVTIEPSPPTVRPPRVSSIQFNNTTTKDVQKTTAEISSIASVLNAQGNTTANMTQDRVRLRDSLTAIVQQVEIVTLEHVQQVLGALEHVTAVPMELANNAQVDASTTLKDVSELVMNVSGDSGTEELEVLSAHILTVAVNVISASNIRAIETKERNGNKNMTSDPDNVKQVLEQVEKNKEATTRVLGTINTFGTILLSRKTRDDKPTLLVSKGFLLSLANTSCERLGERTIRTDEERVGAFFFLPEKAAKQMDCFQKRNGSVGSKTFWTQENPHGYSPNSGDVKTGVQALSFERKEGAVIRLNELQDEARIQLITPRIDQNNDFIINGTTQPESSGNITVHNFNISEPGTSLHIFLESQDDQVPLRLFLQRGADASPTDYSWNTSLPLTKKSPQWSRNVSADPFSWFLSQEELNITEEDTPWSLAAQHEPRSPGSNDTEENFIARYQITIIAARCLFFDEEQHLWEDRGCKVGPFTTRDHLHCLCNHLTSFGFFVAPNKLNIRAALLKIPDDITTNFIVWATVGTAFMLYFILLFWARGRDIREKKKLRRRHGNLVRGTSYNRLLEFHLWASVVRPPSHSTFTRAQRVSCCFSLLMLLMVTNIMFFQQSTENNTIHIGGSEIPLNISLRTVILGLTCTLIAFPPNVIIVLIFRNLSVRRQKTVQLDNIIQARAYQEFGGVYNARRTGPGCLDTQNCTSDAVSTSSGSEHDGRRRGYIDPKTGVMHQYRPPVAQQDGCLPWWFLFIAWFLIFAIVTLSAFFTLLYGVQYGRSKAEAWLFAFLMSFLTDMLLVQPLKVLLIVIFVRLLCKNQTKSTSQFRKALLQWKKLPRAKLKGKLGSQRLADQIQDLDERSSVDSSLPVDERYSSEPSLPSTASISTPDDSLTTHGTDELDTSTEDIESASYLHLETLSDASSDPYPSEYGELEAPDAWTTMHGGERVRPVHSEYDVDAAEDNDSSAKPFRQISYKLR
ncbi:uncharacterized protein LOC118414131 isoform X4 [Branchiostoma floridae]|uniref:Uncharacterized protein LOC118414131 isoform X4 n=1 Tax=Branchiostoma floridae TaxID=7739 RepID=A0A9J7MP11_BRAFL|nr:uncharacterized protein LOC118414131 isoform X4 [Branchiostoma floridae]